MKKFVRNKRVNLRLVLGVVLVLSSVVAVAGVMKASTNAAPILIATKLLVEGHQITAADVTEATAQVDAAAGKYVSSSELAVGKVVNRVIGQGEFVPASSIGSPAEVIETAVVVNVDTPVASGLIPGALVDLWVSNRTVGSGAQADGVPHPAELLLARSRLASHETSSSLVVDGSERVELVVARQDVAKILDAQSAGLAFAVVASNGSLLS